MLNPGLYQTLVDLLGASAVHVRNEDQEGDFYYETVVEKVGSVTVTKRRLKKKESGDPGEEYQMDCMFCSDRRRRMSINHLFGVEDAVDGGLHAWLARCWNCDFQRDYEKRKELLKIIRGRGHASAITGTAKPKVPRLVTWPGSVWPLADILKRQPTHKILTFIEERGWHPQHLASRYHIQYCIDATNAFLPATGRFIAPILKGKKLLGWTARKLSDTEEGPKWYHLPGAGVANRIYNFEFAKVCPAMVLVEGPGDVYSCADPGMGVLGKSLSQSKAQENWASGRR